MGMIIYPRLSRDNIRLGAQRVQKGTPSSPSKTSSSSNKKSSIHPCCCVAPKYGNSSDCALPAIRRVRSAAFIGFRKWSRQMATSASRAGDQPDGKTNGISDFETGLTSLRFFAFPGFTSRSFSAAIRFNNFEAGSSLGSCATRAPRTARLRMVLRRILIWSDRVVSRSKLSMAKTAWARTATGSGSGALSRARLATANRSRVASRLAIVASSRSHKAISSSTLATMRCCSARGGRGNK